MSLIAKAAELRRTILETALKAGKGHVPPALSWVDIAVALYYGGILKAPMDRFVLSKGHGCLTLYAILADLGMIDNLDSFAKGMLGGHPDTEIPGIDACSGSLGHGLGVGAGMALSAKLSEETWRTFVVMGDGELNEGSIWEAAMFASHHQLANLTLIIDYNRLCSANWTREVIGGDWLQRFRAFGWGVHSCDGHNIAELIGFLKPTYATVPTVIFAYTTKGNGVPFMEASPAWHHRMPKGDEIEKARKALA